MLTDSLTKQAKMLSKAYGSSKGLVANVPGEMRNPEDLEAVGMVTGGQGGNIARFNVRRNTGGGYPRLQS